MNFALIGVGGYIASRHLKAIKDIGGNLIAALDKNDSVGILDKYFPDASFFTEFERFERHIEKLKREGTKIQYVSICTPNYLHDAHIRFALRIGADAICEKPVVIKPHNISALQELEWETGSRVWTVLQLRHHIEIESLKAKMNMTDDYHKASLTYITPRGKWYHQSWKANEEKSGGLAMNIGVHFFDMLQWVFGRELEVGIDAKTAETIVGWSKHEKAFVHWHLSISKGERTRILSLDGEPINFTDGFEDLHTEVYKRIIEGGGYGLSEALPSIITADNIRRMNV